MPGVAADLLEPGGDGLLVALEDPEQLSPLCARIPVHPERGVILPDDARICCEHGVRDRTGLSAGVRRSIASVLVSMSSRTLQLSVVEAPVLTATATPRTEQGRPSRATRLSAGPRGRLGTRVRERLSPVRVQGQPPARYDAVGFDAMVMTAGSRPGNRVRAPAARDCRGCRDTVRRHVRAPSGPGARTAGPGRLRSGSANQVPGSNPNAASTFWTGSVPDGRRARGDDPPSHAQQPSTPASRSPATPITRGEENVLIMLVPCPRNATYRRGGSCSEQKRSHAVSGACSRRPNDKLEGLWNQHRADAHGDAAAEPAPCVDSPRGWPPCPSPQDRVADRLGQKINSEARNEDFLVAPDDEAATMAGDDRKTSNRWTGQLGNRRCCRGECPQRECDEQPRCH